LTVLARFGNAAGVRTGRHRGRVGL
jgi:hypothetical protein